MARRAKPGAVLIQPADAPRGEVVTELTETLERLDYPAARKIRNDHAATYLYIAEASQLGEPDWWYEQAPRTWQKKADRLLDYLVDALQRAAPKGHYFAGRRDSDGAIYWGYWEKERRNPEGDDEDTDNPSQAQDEEADLLHGGYQQNKRPKLLQDGPEGTVYAYRGRYVVVRGSNVQIVRDSRSGEAVILEEWESDHPFPYLDGLQAVELMRQASKKRRSKKRNAAFLRVPAEMKRVGGKQRGMLFRYRGHVLDVQPIGELTATDVTFSRGKTVGTILDSDGLVVGTVADWGGGPVLEGAKSLIDKAHREQPKGAKRPRSRSKGASFMRRMMDV